jgi:hypothetical protein
MFKIKVSCLYTLRASNRITNTLKLLRATMPNVALRKSKAFKQRLS